MLIVSEFLLLIELEDKILLFDLKNLKCATLLTKTAKKKISIMYCYDETVTKQNSDQVIRSCVFCSRNNDNNLYFFLIDNDYFTNTSLNEVVLFNIPNIESKVVDIAVI